MSSISVSLGRMSQSIRWAFNCKEWNPSEKDFAHAISCVQLEEKERLGRFAFRRDVKASLVGRLLMRKFVNEYASIPYDEIKFTRDQNNKPILNNTPLDISFNVSHQGDYTVLAGETKDIKLGVDVMKTEYTGGKELSEFFRIMNRNFTSSEWNEIQGVSVKTTDQIAMFVRHWALKESYLKAIGIGIVTDLRALDFKTNSKLIDRLVTTDTVLYVDGAKENWLFEEAMLDAQHCVAVALQENGMSPQSGGAAFKVIDRSKLFANAVSLFPEDLQYTKTFFKKELHP